MARRGVGWWVLACALGVAGCDTGRTSLGTDGEGGAPSMEAGGAGGFGGGAGAGGGAGVAAGGSGGRFDAGSTDLGAQWEAGVPSIDAGVMVDPGALCAGKTDNNAPMFTAQEFCALFAQVCATVATTITSTNCLLRYANWSSLPFDGGSSNLHGQQGCRSYHLCNAARGGPPVVHCSHAEGKTGPDAGANTFCM